MSSSATEVELEFPVGTRVRVGKNWPAPDMEGQLGTVEQNEGRVTEEEAAVAAVFGMPSQIGDEKLNVRLAEDNSALPDGLWPFFSSEVEAVPNA